MEYQRIHKDKVQTGIISPSKLRMKLSQFYNGIGSNTNSSTTTSPSRTQDAEFLNNSLLASDTHHNLDPQVTSPSLEVLHLDQTQSDPTSCESKGTNARKNGQHSLKAESINSRAIHPVKTTEDESLDYDSNASSSSFEFHKGGRPVTVSNPSIRYLLRPIPSKWNDAEKWIMNRQHIAASYSKKNALQRQTNHLAATSMVRANGKATETKQARICHSASDFGSEKFSFVPSETCPISSEAHQRNPALDSFPQSKDLKEVNELNLSCSTSTDGQTDISGIRSVTMRDMGTEMTPMTSQEPSRTATPVSSTSPLRSSTSSMPSSPRIGVPAPTPLDSATDEDLQFPVESQKQLTEEEMKLKTRREIAALGVQLGKMNIAAWASKDEEENKRSPGESVEVEEHERIEFGKHAALGEEAEKSKHTARYKREEIKIQAWESKQKAKLEAEMRRIEVKAEEMRAQAQAKMVKKITMARQISEEKRQAAEAHRNQHAERTAAKAEYIRHSRQIPCSNYICCGWFRSTLMI